MTDATRLSDQRLEQLELLAGPGVYVNVAGEELAELVRGYVAAEPKPPPGYEFRLWRCVKCKATLDDRDEIDETTPREFWETTPTCSNTKACGGREMVVEPKPVRIEDTWSGCYGGYEGHDGYGSEDG